MRKTDGTGATWRRPHWIPEEVIDAADVCFMILETDGRILYLNRATENLLGCRTADVCGTPLQEVVTAARGAALTPVLQQTRLQGTAFLPGWPAGVSRPVAWTFSLVTRPGWGRAALVGVGLADPISPGVSRGRSRSRPPLHLVKT